MAAVGMRETVTAVGPRLKPEVDSFGTAFQLNKPHLRPFNFLIMKHPLAAVAVLLTCSIAAAQEKVADGFVTLFDGKSLAGWHVSAKTGHSRASKNQSGGKWVVE